MRVFIACLGTETNTFSPLPTGLETFEERMLFRGDATQRTPNLFSEPMHVWRKLAEADGHEVVEGLAAFAEPAGLTVGSVFEQLRDELVAGLKAAMPVDMVLLSMHGAMVADGYDDAEGEVIARVREVVGPDVPVGVEFDLHCQLTEQKVAAATAIVTFKEYPHIDAPDRAAEVYDLVKRTALGEICPVMSVWDTRMISVWRTPQEPVRSFVDKMAGLEGRDGILSISFSHCFPWADLPDVSAKMLVIADGDAAKAAALAESLGREVWAMRNETHPVHDTIDEAIDFAGGGHNGPVVCADVSDNAGGGAPGDSTFILKRLIERGVENVASGLYWDPVAARFCIEAGEGATLDLRLGGKCGPMSGDPVDLSVTVRGIRRGAEQSFGTAKGSMGDAVWVSAGTIDLVIITRRTQCFHPDAFTQFGIDLATKRMVVVKSSQHFHAGFAPIASAVRYVAAPGAITPDFASLPFKRMTKPYWPKVEDPWAAE